MTARHLPSIKVGANRTGTSLEVAGAWDADDELTVGIDGHETYLDRHDAQALRAHLDAALAVPRREPTP